MTCNCTYSRIGRSGLGMTIKEYVGVESYVRFYDKIFINARSYTWVTASIFPRKVQGAWTWVRIEKEWKGAGFVKPSSFFLLSFCFFSFEVWSQPSLICFKPFFFKFHPLICQTLCLFIQKNQCQVSIFFFFFFWATKNGWSVWFFYLDTTIVAPYPLSNETPYSWSVWGIHLFFKSIIWDENEI